MSSMEVKGINFDTLLSADGDEVIKQVLDSSKSVGLQATNLGLARELVQRALHAKRSCASAKIGCSYTSNMVSSGLREVFAFLAQHRLVDAFVSTGGGVEEDVIKCLGKTLLGDFALRGSELRAKGLNRIGNLLVPNDNYCAFENFFVPVIQELHKKQRECRWTQFTSPSEIIWEMGAAMERDAVPQREQSVVYWCYRNRIPMFCPALTDGSMGDMIYFYNFSKKGLVVDPMPDLDRLELIFSSGEDVTALVLGGGLPKHHLLRAMRRTTGAKRVLMITTGLIEDGCVSSCSLSDDVSEGSISETDVVVRLHGDATLLFPLLL